MIEDLVTERSDQPPRELVKRIEELDRQNLSLERSQRALLNVMEDLKESETRVRQTRDALEARVRQRTVELFTANQRLELEIDERDRQVEARTAAETARREQEQRLRLITDSVPALIAYVGADRRYQFVNDGYRTMFGRTSSGVIGHHMREILGASYTEIEPRVDQVLRGEAVEFNLTIPNADGMPRDLHAHCIPQLDAQRKVTGFFALVTDITERKQTERALQESEAMFRALAEHSQATITLSDDQRFVYVNPRAEEVTGYTQTALLGMKFAGLLPPDVRQVIVERAQARLRGEDASHHYELPFLKKDGERRWLDVTATVVEMGGQVLSLATGIDITERKQADAEVRSLTARVLTAREDEQQRLARDLHDSFHQRQAAISIDIGLIRQRGSDVPRDVRRELATVQDAVVEVSQDLQRVARDLHPAALAQVGLVRALEQHCREVSQREGITVHFSADLGDRSVAP